MDGEKMLCLGGLGGLHGENIFKKRGWGGGNADGLPKSDKRFPSLGRSLRELSSRLPIAGCRIGGRGKRDFIL